MEGAPVYLNCESEKYLGGYGQSPGFVKKEMPPEVTNWPYMDHIAPPNSGNRTRNATVERLKI
jgi:hypothetical protein